MPIQIHRFSCRPLFPWTFVLLAGAATAQTSDELAKSSLPNKVQYMSTLSGYQAYVHQPVQPWREANDRVGRIGGWRSYAKESKTIEPAQDAPIASDPHTRHHGVPKP